MLELMEKCYRRLFSLFDYPLTLLTIAMILDTLGICREKFIFCNQLKNFRFSENVFQICFSLYPSEFFKNPEKETTGVL